MPDWIVAAIYVALQAGLVIGAAHRRDAGRPALPGMVLVFVLAAFAVGALIAEWWAVALALAVIVPGAIANRGRARLRLDEALVGTVIDAGCIALGCAIARVL